MFTLLVILILIVSALLIVAVLLQNSKKEGMGSPLGDMGAMQLIGVQKTTDVMEQLTWGLIITLFVLTLGSSLVLKKKNFLPISPNIQRAQEQGILPNEVEVAPETPASSEPSKE